MAGNDTANTKIATNDAAAIAHSAPFFKVRPPIRCAAWSTIAVTAGLIPANTPATTGRLPKAIYTHDRPTTGPPG